MLSLSVSNLIRNAVADLVLKRFGFVFQTFQLSLLTGYDFVLLAQFASLIMDEVLFGRKIAIEVLQHGLQCDCCRWRTHYSSNPHDNLLA